MRRTDRQREVVGELHDVLIQRVRLRGGLGTRAERRLGRSHVTCGCNVPGVARLSRMRVYAPMNSLNEPFVKFVRSCATGAFFSDVNSYRLLVSGKSVGDDPSAPRLKTCCSACA